MRFVVVSALIFSSLAVAAFHPVVEGDASDIRIRIDVGAKDYKLVPVSLGGVRYVKFVADEGLNQAPELIGTPDLPRVHRWIALDPEQRYKVEWQFEKPVTYTGVRLYPTQEDPTDCGGPAPAVAVDRTSYAANRWLGAEGVLVGARSRLGAVTVLPLTILPAEYHPVRRELVVWRKISIRIKADSHGAQFLKHGSKLTRFARSQASRVVLNARPLLHALPPVTEPKRVLVLASEDMLAHASSLAALYPTREVTAIVRAVESGITSVALRDLIRESYDEGGLDGVVLVGDKTRLPLHRWSSSLPGDAFYGLVEGDDSIADVGVGRLPVATDAEARLILNKLRRYRELQASGHKSPTTLLVAHKESYPGKYTGNMQAVIDDPNPKGLTYVAHFGGAGATNADVIESAGAGAGLITYRGHGGTANWSPWGRDGKAFSSAELDQFPNDAAKLAVFFNIACLNGGIHATTRSLVQRQLFPSDDPEDMRGGVAAIGATIESMTEVNHRFARYLHAGIQDNDDISLGVLFAAANNQLVRDNGGSLVSNVKMYILFGDPLLAPWVQ